MSRAILMGCLWVLATATQAQENNRVRSGTPLRWGMNGSIEVMEGDLAVHYGRNDTAARYRQNIRTPNAPFGGNPYTTRFTTVQARCDHNSISLNWVAVQASGSDRYQVEQSTDGRNWTPIGLVPAVQNNLGQASYNFQSAQNAGSNAVFRITAVRTSGERVHSAIVESPCSNNAYFAVTPNPVYSTATIRVGSPVATKVKMMLVNSSGVLLQTRETGLLPGSNSVPLDMSGLPIGSYTLFIHWGSGKQQGLNLIKQ